VVKRVVSKRRNAEGVSDQTEKKSEGEEVLVYLNRSNSRGEDGNRGERERSGGGYSKKNALGEDYSRFTKGKNTKKKVVQNKGGRGFSPKTGKSTTL